MINIKYQSILLYQYYIVSILLYQKSINIIVSILYQYYYISVILYQYYCIKNQSILLTNVFMFITFIYNTFLLIYCSTFHMYMSYLGSFKKFPFFFCSFFVFPFLQLQHCSSTEQRI